MKRLFLATGLVVALTTGALAHSPRPSVNLFVVQELSAKQSAALGVYKAEMPGVPTITIKAKGNQLIMAAEGYPELDVTLNDKDELVAAVLPEGFKFTLVKDKDGKVTGLKVETPMGGGELKKQAEAAKPAETEKATPAKKAELPDVLGKYEAEDSASPVTGLEIVAREGKLFIIVEGQPEISFTLDKMDNVVSPNAPEGITSKFQRDKDGKITHLVAETPVGKLSFKRKTFPKPPAAEKKSEPEKKGDAATDAVARLKALEGVYTSEMPGLPTITMRMKDGKLTIDPEGNPPIADAKLSDKDELTGEGLPEGFVVKIVRDKDGKVTGMTVSTPMGDASFTRAPLK